MEKKDHEQEGMGGGSKVPGAPVLSAVSKRGMNE